MDQNERRIIDDLFARLGEAERRAAPRDGEALRLIQDHLGRQPAAPYYMAQAIVVQQEALANAQAQVEQLERELSERPAGGGFLGGLFGGGERAAPRPAVPSHGGARHAPAGQGPWSRPQGGGFLAGAAQTAMGVAGGMLVANALAGMLAPDQAQAAEPGMAEDLAGGEDPGVELGIHLLPDRAEAPVEIAEQPGEPGAVHTGEAPELADADVAVAVLADELDQGGADALALGPLALGSRGRHLRGPRGAVGSVAAAGWIAAAG